MISAKAVAVNELGQPFEEVVIERRDIGPRDVLIEIAYCGICHSDVSYVRNEWHKTIYPIVPGHEIAGIVAAVGSEVTKFTAGDRAGVGCLVDTCGTCANCAAGEEQHCSGQRVSTYSSTDRDGSITLGGYSDRIVVDEDFVVRIPDGVELANAAPLLCAGVTVYSPLRHWGVSEGTRVAVIGLGGLGHIAVKIACALGATVTVLDLSESKRDSAIQLGASDFKLSTERETFVTLDQTFDVIINTVPANLDLDAYMRLLRLHGTFVMIGVPERDLSLNPFSLIVNERVLAGSRIGSLTATQEMMNFCADHGIGAEIEIVTASQLAEAYDRMVRGDVRFRFVLDVASIGQANVTSTVAIEPREDVS